MSRGRADIAQRLAVIAECDTAALRIEWTALFGQAAPARLSRDLLARAVAHRIQERAFGELRPATRRRLALPANGDKANSIATRRALTPGTHLVREWRGEVHQVTALDDGFDYRGTRYRSLSEIARSITGTRWSGPRFFGLHKSGTGTKNA